MRSWIATGNNLLNAHDIKEGMKHAGGIKNTKVAVAEIIPGAGIRADREYYDLLFCPVTGCTATFKSNIELDVHIATDLHTFADDETRTTNDIARIHLTKILRSTSTRSRSQSEAILQHQNTTAYDPSTSFHYRFLSTCG
ncbi:unnamed protein product [Rotaria sp. Silwood2]|nr:unnamed protein product [Rotaria sp. Silwood2]CAF3508658.1 unnamed protein product [Rotaria sp. Silwood2]CAF4569130.1 unnamed protein product [Rotaria sp. Silwood2]CAF4734357.1 unnamed protein product [Rotaria sp. Silwood2]